MPPPADDRLKLLLVAQPDDALARALCNEAGFTQQLDARYVHDAGSLNDQISAERWDVVLARTRINGTTLSSAVDTVRSFDADVPVIGLADAPDHSQVVAAMLAGARDLVDPDAREHLRLVIERELANLRARRERRLLDLQHREFQRQTFNLLNQISDPVLIVRAGLVQHANPSALAMFGYAGLDDLHGNALSDMVALVDRPRLQSFVGNLSAGTKRQRLDVSVLSRDGLFLDVSMTFSSMSFGGQRGHLVILRAAPGRADAQRALYSMTRWDQLTGLHTQRHFLSCLSDAIAVGGGALLLIELENFRAMRESVGIVATDLLVKDLAAVVAREAHDASAIGRFGNHTFAVLLQDVDLQAAARRARQLLAGVERHTSEIAGQSLATTCSVSVVPVSRDGDDAESVMREAERLCRDAIASGGNRVAIAVVPDEVAVHTPRNRGGDDLAVIVGEGALRISWQPIVHLHGGHEESYEVALCVQGEDGTLVPADALEANARPETLSMLDRWLIEQAIRTAHARQAAGHDVHFFVRLSAASVDDESVLLHLTHLLRGHGVRRDCLTFQIPEESAARQVRSARAFVSAARKLYCTTALDGFGEHVTSMHALERLGVDCVKLGAAQIADVARDGVRRLRLERLQADLKNLAKTSVATGVNDADTLMVLWQCGVDYAQGDGIQPASLQMGYDFTLSLEEV